ncbi:MAG TPA: ATP-grasp fold amidoligase family protein [Nitrospira sp.]|nr:ATP-grasp fold amidoligase family protein [Nitrospira sp.]
MERVVPPTELTALRGKLRDTWLLHQYRSIKRRVLRRSEGEAFLLRRYARIHGKPLNLTNPQTYTEKLFWRMITWNRGNMPLRVTQLADKYAVRAYVANTVGKQHLIKLLWQGNDPRAIPFDRLPDEYVIKPNHAAGQVIIVKGQADRDEIIQTISGWLASNYYWQGREFQYYGIPPRIVIEEYLTNEDGSPPFDYKFHCFNGVPEHILVRNHTHDICPYFDTTWNLLDFSDKVGAIQPWVPKPVNLEEMLALAAKLSVGFGYVRMDFYNVKGRVYFGEFTFTPAAGILKYTPESWDLTHGEKWDLSLDAKTRT